MTNTIHALIIDDDVNNVGVLAQLLEWEGVTYTQVLNPLEIERVLTQLQKVDIIFLDLEMPDIDGYTVFEMFKSNEHFKDIPVVAHTVHFGERHTAQQVGFHSFLGKPLNIERFPVQLASILSGERIWSIS